MINNEHLYKNCCAIFIICSKHLSVYCDYIDIVDDSLLLATDDVCDSDTHVHTTSYCDSLG
jgi:hypothetical protein